MFLLHSPFYNWKHHLKPFGHIGGEKHGEEKGYSLSELRMTVFVEQPLASPGLAKEWSCQNYAPSTDARLLFRMTNGRNGCTRFAQFLAE